MTQSPLITLPKSTLALSPAYYGSISRYALMARYGHTFVDNGARFDKRLKSTHRTEIADVNGRMNLTVPIVKPESLTRSVWSDIHLSTHGEWWHVHLTALESAYGRTPFFEFYIDRFLPMLSRHTVDRYVTLTSLNDAIEREICDILGIASPGTAQPNEITDDMRGNRLPRLNPIEYYQIRKDRQGFIPDLSILDLIFNIGPESPLILAQIFADPAVL